MSACADLLGVTAREVHTILKWAKVPMVKHGTARYFIDAFDAEEALVKWDAHRVLTHKKRESGALEMMTDAAKRLGISRQMLKTAMVWGGLDPKRNALFRHETLTIALEQYQAAPSVRSLAKQHGADWRVTKRLCAALHIDSRRDSHPRLRPTQVRAFLAALAAYRKERANRKV